jgi:hypothetical protein
MLHCNIMTARRKPETGVTPNQRTFKVFFFKTQLTIPSSIQITDGLRSYRGAIRYGHARLRRPASPAVALTPIELPRVQAVVDAIRYDRAA